MSEALVRYEVDSFMPVMDIRQAKGRRDALVGFVQGIMVEGQDFGKIPGTDKPTLLKPGAEKLVTFFGLTPVFASERVTENFGDDGSEPLFFYRYRCELYRNGVLMGTGIGSCNSRESKYRYRNADRACPNCGKAAITKSKYPPKNQPNAEPGWYCYSKKGGCGAEFGATDTRITGQVAGRIPNPDVADLVNTVDKMAQKRALISSTLIAVNASEFFTQDVEDMTIGAEYSLIVDPQPTTTQKQAATAQPQRQPQPAQTQRTSTPQPPPVTEVTSPPVDNPFEDDNAGHEAISRDEPITAGQLKALHGYGMKAYGSKQAWDAKRKEIVGTVTKNKFKSAAFLTRSEADRLIDGLKKKIGGAMSDDELTGLAEIAGYAPEPEELAAVPEMAH